MPKDPSLPDLASLEAAAFIDARRIASPIPRLEQYFGLWAILEEPFQGAVRRFNGLNLNLHIEQYAAEASDGGSSGSRRGYQLVKGGVALIDISGTLMKSESSLGGSQSTIAARRAVRQAAADDEVTSILLRIDSPGGTVSGTGDLAADVAAAAAKKPLYAYAEDTCCSAAYWIASQADKVFANATALVGSIGTYGVVEDSSAAAEQQGIKVHVIKAGAFKGTGVEGTAVTEDQLSMLQDRIDATNEHFIRGVSAGRKMTLAATREAADGRAFLAADAVKKGLIDGVQSFDETLAQLSAKSKPKPTSRSSKAMADESTAQNTAPQPATFNQLKAACIGADATFLVAQLTAAATLDEARANWMAEQSKQLAAARADAEQAKASLAKPGVKSPPSAGGKKPTAEADANANVGDASEQWHAAIDAKMESFRKRGQNQKLSDRGRRARAIAAVVEENPDLHAAYMESYKSEYADNVAAQSRRAAAAATQAFA